MSIRKIRRICRNLNFDLKRVAYDEPEFYQKFHGDHNYATVRNRSVWAMYAVDENCNRWKTGPNQETVTSDRLCVALLFRPWYSLRAPDALIFDSPIKKDLQFILAPYISSIITPSFESSIERQTADSRWVRLSPDML
jgi:hypothetical protein